MKDICEAIWNMKPGMLGAWILYLAIMIAFMAVLIPFIGYVCDATDGLFVGLFAFLWKAIREWKKGHPVGFSYVMAFIFPVIGVWMGVKMIIAKQQKHGRCIIIISAITIPCWWFFWEGFLYPPR
jgi:hypothetical protein